MREWRKGRESSQSEGVTFKVREMRKGLQLAGLHEKGGGVSK